MKKLLLIAVQEFRMRVRQRGFILGSLIAPLLLLAFWFFGSSGNPVEDPMADLFDVEVEHLAIGYVDQADLIHHIPDSIPAGMFHAFAEEAQAEEALRLGEIDLFYLIPSEYRQSGEVMRVSMTLPTAPADEGLMDWVLVANLVPDVEWERAILMRWPFPGDSPTFMRLDSQANQDAGANPSLVMMVTVLVMVPLFTGGSLLFQSLTKEKSNRVMEILLVSLRPQQLLAGKVLGLGALTMFQYALWAGIVSLVVGFSGRDVSTMFSTLHLTPQELIVVLPFALAGFGLYSGIMAGMGALTRDMESNRMWVFLFTLPMLIPIYFGTAIIELPNSLLAVGLSLFPFSAPVTMVMRMTSTHVPAWQIATSLVLLTATGIGIILLMARLFRAQTLLSGENFSLSRLREGLRGAQGNSSAPRELRIK